MAPRTAVFIFVELLLHFSSDLKNKIVFGTEISCFIQFDTFSKTVQEIKMRFFSFLNAGRWCRYASVILFMLEFLQQCRLFASVT
jgi:hypothetical protein